MRAGREKGAWIGCVRGAGLGVEPRARSGGSERTLMEAMRSCLLNGFVVVFVSTSVATARTAKSTRDPGIATRRDVAGREGEPRVENAEDAALRPRHPTPLRTTRRVVIIAAIANGEESSNARRVASSSVARRVARRGRG